MWNETFTSNITDLPGDLVNSSTAAPDYDYYELVLGYLRGKFPDGNGDIDWDAVLSDAMNSPEVKVWQWSTTLKL